MLSHLEIEILVSLMGIIVGLHLISFIPGLIKRSTDLDPKLNWPHWWTEKEFNKYVGWCKWSSHHMFGVDTRGWYYFSWIQDGDLKDHKWAYGPFKSATEASRVRERLVNQPVREECHVVCDE